VGGDIGDKQTFFTNSSPIKKSKLPPHSACFAWGDNRDKVQNQLGFTGNGIKCTAVKDPCKPNPCYPGVSCITIWKGRYAHFGCGLCPEGKTNRNSNLKY